MLLRRMPAVIALALVWTLPVAPPSASVAASPQQRAPKPVQPSVEELRLSGVDASALRDDLDRLRGTTNQMGATRVPGSPAPTPEVLTRQLETSPFDMVGVVWDAESTPAGGAVQIRVRERQGWTEWQELEAADGGPDPRSQEGQQAAERAATEPLFVEDADAVQVRMDTADGAEPQQVTAVLVDPGDSAADEDAFALATASGSFRAFLIV